jgi:hypothetical protein
MEPTVKFRTTNTAHATGPDLKVAMLLPDVSSEDQVPPPALSPEEDRLDRIRANFTQGRLGGARVTCCKRDSELDHIAADLELRS